MKRTTKTAVVVLTAFTLLFTSPMMMPLAPQAVQAETSITQPLRLAGTSRYDTAIQVSQGGWNYAESVVLARGDDFPDALAGVVLTKSVNAPLLLTETKQLTTGVLDEIQRLGASTVYILGSRGAVSEEVENALINEGLQVERLEGTDRYITASEIAKVAVPQTEKAFLALGTDFPDALSISSYAAAQGIPLLLTEKKKVPEVTLETLQSLGVKEVTLIGGEGVILPEVKVQLEELGFGVDRLAGTDRYGTNLEILNGLSFNNEAIYVATGTKFPDALAGAALAAKNNNPIVLVPQKDLKEESLDYLGARRGDGSHFTLLGGWGVISYGMESIIRTGNLHPKISLQYWDGYAKYETYLNQLSMIPNQATDYVDYVSPNWRSSIGADGTLKLVWEEGSSNYRQLTNMAHGLGMKVLPLINGSGATINTLLKSPAAQEKLIAEIVKLLNDTRSDGVIIDFETPLDYGDAKDPYDGVRNDLTRFMESLYAELKPMNKIVVMTVMPRMSSSQYWLDAFDYEALSHTVDYMHVMTYDHHYRTSAPGAIAPYPWIKQVLTYVKDQGVDMSKVMMGLPYYGRDWVVTGKDTNGNPTYNSTAFGYSKALEIADAYGAEITYSKDNDKDPVGTPTFKYTDDKGVEHTVFFDDFTSWNAKLGVINEFGLAGVGPWAMGWVDEETAEGLYPLLNQHLR
ncbi:putative glycosyl hydrolase [Desulfitobacterium dichloroeliminans LMG P-21439]|uniref:Putative glycosyl hydrolase n=1 Tax=Desulfitobacterium dichloroeliminans (strain LMG P-21439 / DCA1) TaxID=871963 RepID=L0FCF0_DESDL|nr:cell wall-binding repeat-containing protein [Desulfitobacterium dichloroeliminans]AGA70618.1 putative glycosyl hydrolase [Desulfitobacterium dichloroeliminans LMG P-21439]